MTKTTKVLLLLAALVLLAALTSRAQTDPGVADTVYIDSVVAFTINSAEVPIRFVNDEALGAAEVTLTYRSTEITLDSVSFVGSRLENAEFLAVSQLSDTVVTIFASPQGSVSPGEGLLATLHFSYPVSITPQTIAIDTITVIDNFKEYSTNFQTDTASPGTEPFKPQSQKGYLTIEEAPATLDSIWVNNYEVEPGDSFVVDVGLYNERDIKDLQVGLSWGSSYLTFNKVTFDGTRAETATQKLVSGNNTFHYVTINLEYNDAAPLVPASGVLAHVHFFVEPGSQDTSLTIDTGGTALPTLINYTVGQGGDQIIPIFNEGVVDIKVPTDVEDITDPDNLPTAFALNQNYPNPFNPTTEIEFSLPTASEVRLDVFNILGRKVRTLVDQFLPAGTHRVTFDARAGDGGMLASGVYFYKISAEDFTQSRKMLLVK